MWSVSQLLAVSLLVCRRILFGPILATSTLGSGLGSDWLLARYKES